MITVVVVCATVVICFAMTCAVVLRVSELWFDNHRPRTFFEMLGARRNDCEDDE